MGVRARAGVCVYAAASCSSMIVQAMLERKTRSSY